MNIKEFFKRNNLDEMQKQTLLKIESRGFWVLWVLLLAVKDPTPPHEASKLGPRMERRGCKGG